MKALNTLIEYVRNIALQIKADSASFERAQDGQRREAYVSGRMTELEENFAEAKAAHLKIITSKEDNTLKETYNTDEVFIKLKETFFEYKGKLTESLQQDIKENGNTTTQENPIDLKLRRIELPPFSGGYEQWRPFHELYMSLIHNNNSLSDVQKLHYLKSTIHGEAGRLLQHVSLEGKNYASAWTILTERYENKRVLVNTHLRILMSQKNIVNESAESIKGILDTTTECLHSLRNLGVPVDTWDMILVYTLCAKLPTTTQEAWEAHLQGAKNLIEYNTFAKFLETRFRTLESIEQSKVDSRRTSKPFNQGNFFKQSQSFHNNIGCENQSKYSNNSDSCHLCYGNHKLNHCDKFIKMNVQNRYETAKKLSACINCLSYNHKTYDCRSSWRCKHCKNKHHSLLHIEQTKSNHHVKQGNSSKNNKKYSTTKTIKQENTHQAANIQSSSREEHLTMQQNNAQQSSNQPNNRALVSSQPTSSAADVNSLFTQPTSQTKVLLATALVKCQAENGDYITLRALVDPGSEATFISETAVQKLRLKKRKAYTNIVSLGQAKTGVSQHQVTVIMSSTYNSKFSLTINALVYTNITSILPSETFDTREWHHLQNLSLADPHFNTPGKVDLLLGADAYAAIILPGLKKGPIGSPIAQQSEIGWIISGNILQSNQKTIQTHHQLIDIDSQLRRFWEIEDITDQRKPTEEEQDCEQHYVQTHKRQQDGRYQVCIPFKNNTRPILKNTRQAAISRLFQLENRFKTNSTLKETYTACINEYLQLSHMTETSSSESGQLYYLPHHAVFKESSTTKLRIVFDASCKAANGKSLNECMMIGPTLQNELSSIINKWRKFRYAYTADITKMYRQIWMDPEDRNYQKICWRNEQDKHIKTYTLNTVTFGTASAPFLAVRTLLQLADDEEHKYPIAANILRQNFYVDDVMHGADSIEEALEAQRQLIEITNSAGFPLRKWASNNAELLQPIPENDREIKTPLTLGKEEFVKTLGFQWYPGSDVFKYKITLPVISKISKRSILSDISKLFDPHGWISPCIVHAKIIMQELWVLQLGWDDPIPDKLEQQWLKYREELASLEKIEIPRWVQTTKSSHIQLHGFSDASERAYAAVVYVRVITGNTAHIHLLASKTKIAPLKRVSLPRLELCAAVLLSKLIKSIQQSMDFQTVETYAWTDSMIALSWIRANPSKWKPFVANRVAEIQSLSSKITWNHIGTKQNPADVASRGIFPSEIQELKIWWQGPPMLKTFSPNTSTKAVNIETDLEIRKVHTLIAATSESFIKEIAGKYSNLQKLQRIVALCQRAAYNFKHAKSRNTEILTVAELEDSLNFIIKMWQAEEFRDEISSISKQSSLPKCSKILMLHPFLDKGKLLRVGGRLQNANLEYNRQHPIILPRNGHLTDLIISDAHSKTKHGGQILTAEHLQNRYWIICAKKAIKKIVNRCVICFKFNAKRSSQLMGNLPSPRVQIARPFYNTGVDYAGPLEIKAWKGRCNKFFKGYIAIFICLCTKAIHIELVSDFDHSSFHRSVSQVYSSPWDL